MKQFSVIVAIVVVFACFCGIEASSLPACIYGPSNTAVVQGQSFVERREDGWCLRRVDCTVDLQIKVLECKDIPCAADKRYYKTNFPDCCCGGRRNFS